MQELLIHFLKHLDTKAAMKTLYMLAFKESAPEEFGLRTADSDQKKAKNHCELTTDVPIKLMNTNYTFGHGDSGGVIISFTADGIPGCSDDVLGRLTGDMSKEYEIQALCLVELLSGVKRDGLAGDFFLHLMQELTDLIAEDSTDVPSRGEVLLLILECSVWKLAWHY